LKAASGKLMLRVSLEVHAKALATAKTGGKSLNQWTEEVLSKAAHGGAGRKTLYTIKAMAKLLDNISQHY
jgi:hypothetical protein